VTFDPNHRPALWDSPQAAAAAMDPVLEHVSWYLCGAAEGESLLGADAVGALAARDVSAAVRSADGAMVAAGGEVSEVAAPRPDDVVDEVGAGDAFAAGFAYGLLQGWAPEESAHAGNVLAAHALSGTGDWETLPRLDEVAAELRPAENILRG
jgi:2-dehydro-3-deoxygluconokinase